MVINRTAVKERPPDSSGGLNSAGLTIVAFVSWKGPPPPGGGGHRPTAIFYHVFCHLNVEKALTNQKFSVGLLYVYT